jgi:hypothetical protein
MGRTRLLIPALIVNPLLVLVALGWLAWVTTSPRYWSPGRLRRPGTGQRPRATRRTRTSRSSWAGWAWRRRRHSKLGIRVGQISAIGLIRSSPTSQVCKTSQAGARLRTTFKPPARPLPISAMRLALRTARYMTSTWARVISRSLASASHPPFENVAAPFLEVELAGLEPVIS